MFSTHQEPNNRKMHNRPSSLNCSEPRHDQRAEERRRNNYLLQWRVTSYKYVVPVFGEVLLVQCLISQNIRILKSQIKSKTYRVEEDVMVDTGPKTLSSGSHYRRNLALLEIGLIIYWLKIDKWLDL